MRHMHILFVVVFFLFGAVSVRNARASYLYDWANDPAGTLQTVSDPLGDNTGSGTEDILELYYARDAVNHYFRMDLLEAPTLNDGAGTYSIQIDDSAGGGANIDSHYIALGLTGIDQLVMSHFSAGSGEYVANHRHNVLAPTPGVDEVDLLSIGGAVDHTMLGGTVLQWSIPISELNPGPFQIYGSVHTIESNITNDTTAAISASAVPEPSSLVLGAVAFLVLLPPLRRRRLKELVATS